MFSRFLKSSTSSSNKLLESAFTHSPIATLIVDINGFILNVNKALSTLMGYSRSELLSENLSIFKSGKHDNLFYKQLSKNLASGDEYKFDIWNRTKIGVNLLIQEKVVAVDSKKERYYIVTYEDITDATKWANRQQHLATHDALTGLANRTLLEDRYQHASTNAMRKAKKMSVVMCDINEFKYVNDTYGHNFGDVALKEVSITLQKLVRASDTVARYGGDEFIIILEHLENVNEAKKIVEQIIDSFPKVIEHQNKKYALNMSIGYATFPEDGTRFEQLLQLADMKMYSAKKRYYGLNEV